MPAGRPKGSKSRRRADEYIEKIRHPITGAKCDPIMELFLIASDPNTGVEVRALMWKELAQYRFAKLKSVDVAIETTVRQTVINAEPLSEDEWFESYGSLEAPAGPTKSVN